jgi:hypothetical protein
MAFYDRRETGWCVSSMFPADLFCSHSIFQPRERGRRNPGAINKLIDALPLLEAE